MASVTKLVVLSQLSFLLMIGVCVAILPHFLFEHNEGGMSNYGVHASTVVFYTLAFSLSAGLLLGAAHFLPKSDDFHPLKAIFIITACSLLLELATTYPYQLNATFNNLHVMMNFWTAIFELLSGEWIALVFRRNLINYVLFSLLLVSFGLSILVFLGFVHVLFVTQLLGSVSVGLLLIRSTLQSDTSA